MEVIGIVLTVLFFWGNPSIFKSLRILLGKAAGTIQDKK